MACLGGLEPKMYRGELVWQPKAKTTAHKHGHSIDGTCSKLHPTVAGDVGEGPVVGLGGLEPEMHNGGGLLITVN